MKHTPYDYETITVTDSVGSLTAAKVAAWRDYWPMARIHVSGAAICYRIDGGDPTAAEPNYLEPGDVIHLTNYDQMANWRHIRQGSVNADLGVTYFR